MPCGGEDLDMIDGDVYLTFASGNESFVSLETTAVENPNIGEIVYKFNDTIICRNFNYRESGVTKLTKDTKNVFIVIEGITSYADTLNYALNNLSTLIKKYLGGTTKSVIINVNNNGIIID